jgi:hypothetical protein
MKQDKITIHGPKTDGTYIVEFKTADGVALAFSVPRGIGTAVLEHFQDKMPYGLAVPDVPRSPSSATGYRSKLVLRRQVMWLLCHRENCLSEITAAR